jgi:hypothetical protein
MNYGGRVGSRVRLALQTIFKEKRKWNNEKGTV